HQHEVTSAGGEAGGEYLYSGDAAAGRILPHEFRQMNETEAGLHSKPAAIGSGARLDQRNLMGNKPGWSRRKSCRQNQNGDTQEARTDCYQRWWRQLAK